MVKYDENGLVPEAVKQGYKSIQTLTTMGHPSNVAHTEELHINPVDYKKCKVAVQSTSGRVIVGNSSDFRYYGALARLEPSGDKVTVISQPVLDSSSSDLSKHQPPRLLITIYEEY